MNKLPENTNIRQPKRKKLTIDSKFLLIPAFYFYGNNLQWIKIYDAQGMTEPTDNEIKLFLSALNEEARRRGFLKNEHFKIKCLNEGVRKEEGEKNGNGL